MKYILSAIIILFLFYPFYHYSIAEKAGDCCGKCVGSASCNSCKSCQYCAHCNSGGSCGVCAVYTPSLPQKTNVGSRYITPKTSSSSSSTKRNQIEKTEDAILYGKVNTTTLNVRSGPGTKWAIVTKLTYGDNVTYAISENPNWCQVLTCDNFDAIGGFVAKQYID